MIQDPLLDGMEVDIIQLDFSLPEPLYDIQPLDDQPSQPVAAEPVTVTPQPPRSTLPPPQTPSTSFATPPPRSSQRRRLQPQQCQQSDYNELVKAETAKANMHIKKLELQCKLLVKKDKIADLKLALLTKQFKESHIE